MQTCRDLETILGKSSSPVGAIIHVAGGWAGGKVADITAAESLEQMCDIQCFV